jgi:hypothetical protein
MLSSNTKKVWIPFPTLSPRLVVRATRADILVTVHERMPLVQLNYNMR